MLQTSETANIKRLIIYPFNYGKCLIIGVDTDAWHFLRVCCSLVQNLNNFHYFLYLKPFIGQLSFLLSGKEENFKFSSQSVINIFNLCDYFKI